MPFGVPLESNEFLVFLWYSFGIPLVFLWYSLGIPLVFLWYSFGIPCITKGIPKEYLGMLGGTDVRTYVRQAVSQLRAREFQELPTSLREF